MMNIIMITAGNIHYSCGVLCLVFSLFGYGSILGQSLPENIPAQHKQVILVKTGSWESAVGELYLFERKGPDWVKVTEKPYSAVVGKNGLAWGRGLHELPFGVEKKEGDGKAPAGIFTLGEAFGYESSFELKIPYRQATDRDYWIDDVSSNSYNRWASIEKDRANEPKSYWSSYERMKRSDHLYEYGLIINHNMEPIIKGKGSAIFLHVWRREGSPTLGCTALEKQHLINVLKWLDDKKSPLFIQIPEEEMSKLKFAWE